jgi:carbon-monoxide dehydrogenase medium subunit
MKPSPLRYHRPGSLDDAVRLLSRLDGEGKVLAGGQSLVPLLSMRLAAPAHVVDINAVPGLDTVEVGPARVTVGALVRHADLLAHEGVREAQPLVAQALSHVAHPTIRNRGTTVGSVVHADPSGEMPAVTALLGGSVEVASVRGRREILADALFLGPLETSLAPDEVAVALHLPVRAPGEGTAVVEVARRHGDYAVLGVVARVLLAGGTVRGAHAAYVSAGELGQVHDLGDPVAGAAADAADWDACGALAAAVVAVEPDIHATAAYRTALVRGLTARALRAAADHASTGAAAGARP